MIRHIVKARIKGDRRKKSLIRETLDDCSFVFRKYKRKIHKWGTKYGPYNTIKRKAGSCASYDIDKHEFPVDLESVEVLEDITDNGRIAIGFNLFSPYEYQDETVF